MPNIAGVLERLQATAAAVDSVLTSTAAAHAAVGSAIGDAQELGLGGIAARLASVATTVGALQEQVSGISRAVQQATAPVAQAPKEVTPEQAKTVLAGGALLVDDIDGAIAAARQQVGEAESEAAAALDGGDPGPLLAALGAVTDGLAVLSAHSDAARDAIVQVIGGAGTIGGRAG